MGDGADTNDTSLYSVQHRVRVPANRKQSAAPRRDSPYARERGYQEGLLLKSVQEVPRNGHAYLRGVGGNGICEFPICLWGERVDHFIDARILATASAPSIHVA